MISPPEPKAAAAPSTASGARTEKTIMMMSGALVAGDVAGAQLSTEETPEWLRLHKRSKILTDADRGRVERPARPRRKVKVSKKLKILLENMGAPPHFSPLAVSVERCFVC